jgi:hypothetical protein
MKNNEIIFRKRKYKLSPNGVTVFVGRIVGIKDKTTAIGKTMNKVVKIVMTVMTAQ